MSTRLAGLVAGTFLGALLLLPAIVLADQVVLKNGSIIEGEVEVDEARGLVRVKRSGATLSFSMDEVVRVIRDDSKTPKKGKGDKQPKIDPDAKLSVVVIPLHGSFDTYRAREEFDKVLEQAQAHDPKMIVFEISSTGGTIVIAKHFSRRIMALTTVRTAAFIYGSKKGAYSAAAYVALSCNRIYMAPGQAIGAAVAWKPRSDGTPANVSAKFDSAWQAEFRATAEANGHPTAIAGAMVSNVNGLVEMEIAGRKAYITATSYEEERARGQDPQEGTTVRTLCKPGQILTLTSREARRVGISKGTAENTRDFLAKLKVPEGKSTRLTNPLRAGRVFAKKEQTKLDKSIAAFNKQFNKLVAEAPGNRTYETTRTGLFKDNGREWRRRTKASLKYIKRSLKELAAIGGKIKKNPDLKIDRKAVLGYENQLKTFDRELKRLRYVKSPPGRRR